MKVAFLIFSCLGGLTCYIIALNWKTLSKIKKSAAILAGLVSVGTGYYTVTDQIEDNRQSLVNATHGKFNQEEILVQKTPTIQFGKNSSMKNVKYPFMMGNSGETPIYAWISDNKLMANVLIRDSKGKSLIRINRDVWETISPEGIDYNNDDSGYEVVEKGNDERENVIFQMDLINDTVYCTGLFCSESGVCNFVNSNGNISTSIRSNSGKRFDFPKNQITPIFKYPRYDHLGERVSAD